MAIGNKFTRSIDSTILKNRLDVLSRKLQEANASTDIVTREAYLAEAIRALSTFYQDLAAPTFSPDIIDPGDQPDPEDYNNNLQEILDDLIVLFLELENIEGLVLENFNYVVSETNRLFRKMKSVASSVGDFVLFSANALGDAIFYLDSFNNLERVDLESPLLNSKQCEINQVEGIVTLPIIRSPESLLKVDKEPIINDNSNGVGGNNFEVGARRNDDITLILDDNPDTWFEYERVTDAENDTGVELTLDLTLNLGATKVINFVRVNPNNFGTRTQIEIENIETSTDGESFISIKDEIPIPGFEAIDEPNIFTLAASTSKFSGQGLYTFTPRTAKYIHFIFKQKTPYIINTITGERLRYAIGIRDIEVQALRYETEGEIISREVISTDEVRKILLITGQNPTSESELVSITHQISPDSGLTWYQIRPKAFTGFSDIVNEVPEILDFNSGLDGSISTDNPVNSIRYRAILKREQDAFKEGSSSLRQVTKFKTELHQVPSTTPFNIQTDKPPVKGSVCLIDPHFGSRGIDELRYEFGIGNNTAEVHRIPFSNIPLDKVKVLVDGLLVVQEVSPVQFFVNGEEWTRVLAGGLALATATEKKFELDLERGIIRTGDGSDGKAPAPGSILSIGLTPERLLTERTKDGHIAQLGFPSNGDTKSAIVKRFDALTEFNEPLEKASTRHTLANQNIVSNTLSFAPSGIFTTEVNTEVAVSQTGQYYIDYETGVLTTFDTTASISDTTVSYQFQPIVTLLDTEWSYESTDCAFDTVKIRDSAFTTIPVELEEVPTDVKKFSLSNFNVDRGSLIFTVPSGETSPFTDEVEFEDGRTEILGLIRANEAISSSDFTVSGIDSFTVSLVPADTSNHVLVFSRTDIFQTLVTGVPAIPGEYRIVSKEITFFITQAEPKPGTVTYFYSDPTADTTGRYSVNYKLGDVYTFDTITLLGSDPILADYNYSHYEVHYPIARIIPEDDFSVVEETRTITIEDREILRRMQIPTGPTRSLATRNTYQVLYNFVDKDRDNVTDLEPHFSPILKDYTLKVLTKGRLF